MIGLGDSWLLTIAIVGTLGISSGKAQAQSAAFTRCMDGIDYGALKNTQMNACIGQEFERQDMALNSEYKRLKAASPNPEAAEALVIGQRAWLAFRTTWCDYESKLPMAPNPEFNRLFCKVELTSAQTKRIHNNVN